MPERHIHVTHTGGAGCSRDPTLVPSSSHGPPTGTHLASSGLPHFVPHVIPSKCHVDPTCRPYTRPMCAPHAHIQPPGGRLEVGPWVHWVRVQGRSVGQHPGTGRVRVRGAVKMQTQDQGMTIFQNQKGKTRNVGEDVGRKFGGDL